MIKKRSFTRRTLSFGLMIVRNLPQAPFLAASLPLTLFFTLLFPLMKIKFIRLCSDRIGHYAMNTELLLCYLNKIGLEEKNVKYFFYLLNAPVCNLQLHAMWKKIIPIFTFSKIIAQTDNLMLLVLRDRYKNSALKKFETGSGNEDINGDLQKYKPHLSFTNAELQRGRQLLLALGIPIDALYVCLYVRDATYLSKLYPRKDWSYHSHRDCNIQNFSKAALYLAEKGYYVIRMGKTVAKPFEIEHPKIIDYALHSLRSDFADIYLTAHCLFFISTSAGLDGVAQIFRKPILCVNVAPFQYQLQYWYPCELFIIKKIFDKTKKQFISLRKVEEKVFGTNNLCKAINDNDWEVVENTADEILDAVLEIEGYITKKSNEKIGNAFHSLLRKSLPLTMISERDSLRSQPEKFYVRMCDQFWKDNQYLFLE